ncbi:hypothetical protein IW140_001855 [Coemansia sp. RSA 1813]|nr:hypothetical protein EV178_002513 [Coemansia sp. RSA 1646]KAJ1772405.1 hypothetical protein LPJ74_001495 [Coemansia sp. RSA 1843]KAJ2091127.1 hypothetical protein IW138_002089 [Coemansia sp. RSA 986]KAJ2213620.1 hypothetical protein EV179_003736 [Coemansia sp. RSA 487]KAJ2571152.1 hypothetical protein IW140_001855 [Coemansia sp. RSA 1813]
MNPTSIVSLLFVSVSLTLGLAMAQPAGNSEVAASKGTHLRAPLPRIPTVHRRSSPSECNGYSDLCDRQFNLVAFPTTHNSFASGDNIAANQNKDIMQQLDDGIRGFMLDLHNSSSNSLFSRDSSSGPYLCHTSCILLNDGPLTTTLGYFTTFLDAHKDEVITIFLENDDKFSATTIQQSFKDAGLDKYAYTPTGASSDGSYTWPTLADMISQNKRLVVLVDSNSNTKDVPWLVYDRDYAVQTPYTVGVGSSFDCRLISSSRPLLVMNHFVFSNYSVLNMNVEKPSPDTASTVNTRQSLVDQANVCGSAGQFPNFVTVDFYDVGGLFQAVADINKVQYTSTSLSTDFGTGSDSSTTSGASARALPMAALSTALLTVAALALLV